MGAFGGTGGFSDHKLPFAQSLMFESSVQNDDATKVREAILSSH